MDDDVGSTAAGLIQGVYPTVPGIDRHVQQVFGLRGLNDALYRREDRAIQAEVEEELQTFEPDGEFEFAIYQISDPQLSVMATLVANYATTGRIAEEIEYDPYGRGRRTAQGDFNRDGTVGVQDIFDLLAAQSAGHPAADENDDGEVSVQDIFDFLAENLSGDPTPRDRISGQSSWGLIDNPYGYCGYYADGETAAAKVLGPALASGGSGCLYHVRYRVYDPIAGRWLTRDPAGFVDGMNLYEYVTARAIKAIDPLGLSWIQDFGLWLRGAWDNKFNYSPGSLRTYDQPSLVEEARDKLEQSHTADDIVDNYGKGYQAGGGSGGERAFKEAMPEVAAFAEAAIELEMMALGGGIRPSGVVDDVFASGRKAASSLDDGAGAGGTQAVPDGVCFLAGTLVITPSGSVPIEQLRVGDRVHTTETIADSADSSTEAEKSELWLIRLAMPNLNGSNDIIDIDLLRSPEWVIKHGSLQGNDVYLIMAEIGLEGLAKVVEVDECPVIKQGAGRLVLATVTHLNGYVLTLRFEESEETLQPTRTHGLFSVDRGGWVPAGQLVEGERLQTIKAVATIRTIEALPGVHKVYNLEVDTDHFYFVGLHGILSHNVNPCADPRPPVYKKGHPGQPVKDHIEARSLGGKDEPTNIDTKAWETNSRKGAREGQFFEMKKTT